jgi:hypothetical protein
MVFFSSNSSLKMSPLSATVTKKLRRAGNTLIPLRVRGRDAARTRCKTPRDPPGSACGPTQRRFLLGNGD